MLTIESLFGSFLGQLRTVVQMSASRDSLGAPGSGEPKAYDDVPGKSAAHIIQDTSADTMANITETGEVEINETQDKSTNATEPDNTKGKNAQMGPRIRPVRPFKVPEPGSLYDILHDHAGESLYLLPMMWSDRHSDVLGVRFVEKPPILTPVPDNVPGRWLEPSNAARALTSELHILARMEKKQSATTRLLRKTHAIKYVMKMFYPALSRGKSNVDLDIYFGDRVYKKAVRVHCLWKTIHGVNSSFDAGLNKIPHNIYWGDTTIDYAPSQPVLAYVNRSQMKLIREHLFKIVLGPDNTPNEPVKRLQRLRSKLLMPANVDHDPYIISVLISMAQAHFYRPTSRPTSPGSSTGMKAKKGYLAKFPTFRDIKLQVITHEEGSVGWPNFFIYTATVSAAFLQRFRHPDKAFSSLDGKEVDTGLEINQTTVPFFPLLGLKERLAKALGREIAGDPWFEDPEYIRLWDELVAEPEPIYPPVIKRKRTERPPLSEVLNSSFEDDYPSSSDDQPVLSPSAKRRRTAQTTSTLEVC